MKPFRGQNILNFVKELPDDDSCKAYLAKSLTPIFEEHISTTAKIITDKW